MLTSPVTTNLQRPYHLYTRVTCCQNENAIKISTYMHHMPMSHTAAAAVTVKEYTWHVKPNQHASLKPNLKAAASISQKQIIMQPDWRLKTGRCQSLF